MKVKVLKPFIDKSNRKNIYKAGDIIEVSENRYKEITAKGKYVQPVVEKTEKTDKKEK